MQVHKSRVRAAVVGQAVGDALGLPAEFKSAKAVQALVNDKDKWPQEYRATYRKGGVETWRKGEWSDDTEMALCILDTYLAEPEHINLLLLAENFVKWAQTNGRGMGNHTWNCLSDMLFLVDPLEVAREVWENSGRQSAPNGAVMRTSYVGVLRPWDLEWTADAAAQCAAATHTDPRCVASAVAVSIAIACMVSVDADRTKPTSAAEAMRIAAEFAAKHHSEAPEWILARELEDLKLDEGLGGPKGDTMPPIGYTYKCLGAGFWALKSAARQMVLRTSKYEQFYNPLKAVIMAGGDTDTNGAVAGALLGACLGMESIPPALVDGLSPFQDLESRVTRLGLLHDNA